MYSNKSNCVLAYLLTSSDGRVMMMLIRMISVHGVVKHPTNGTRSLSSSTPADDRPKSVPEQLSVGNCPDRMGRVPVV
jgi:hypothetical protein